MGVSFFPATIFRVRVAGIFLLSDTEKFLVASEYSLYFSLNPLSFFLQTIAEGKVCYICVLWVGLGFLSL